MGRVPGPLWSECGSSFSVVRQNVVRVWCYGDMTQRFMTYACGDRAQPVTRELTSRGYDVTNAQRMVPSIQIRVRESTGDKAEVEQVVASLAPDAKLMPEGVPSMNLRGYRDGRP
jgi:hypothetical protein